MHLSSRAVRDPQFPELNPPHQIPLVAASSFIFDSIEQGMAIFGGEEPGHIYGRFGNPTIDAAAEKIAALEGHDLETAPAGLFCASGMAAIATVFLGCCAPGQAVLTQADLYGGTTGLLEQLAPRGITTITADLRDHNAVSELLERHPEIRIIYVETPSNPTLRVTDLRALAELAHAHGSLLVADNTFATPFVQRPLSLGADIVVHSTTKFINGHGTGIAGAIVCKDPQLLREQLIPVYRLYGGNGNPWDAWLVLNGLKTLPLRMERHSENALEVAQYLQKHPEVARVNYPGLSDHPDRPVIDRQMELYGGMLSFELRGGTAAGMAFMNKIKFCTLTPTLGDVDTLVLHPATMSHRGVAPEVRLAHGITDGLVRLSVGVEKVEDIIADLAQAIG
ncbi:PLP-dependent aspartate aminotransferase family protein [Lewinella sp. W8]|uniref:trans-sulfuration enzyme family protein n=1 Tax=Lewinella sp. W8 TaxID=2528208 RepID=UPI001067B92C|nr:aminotransferase class I/II-fold pyridoxal phosphate-dependent enzyme [Lewinella sp. W8]MTB50098.1 aminotransferase class I/II-fold pyridoxal phosphate-dependent enzyme [Lewinella sp. W8]